MSQATEINSREFDSIFFSLPRSVKDRIDDRIRYLGNQLPGFPHHRLQGRPEFPLRVGDYRVILRFIDCTVTTPFLCFTHKDAVAMAQLTE